MGLRNLQSDLSDYFKKKEPYKPSGKLASEAEVKKTTDLGQEKRLETYKTPEIKTDASGKPIIPTDFRLPDTKTRYTDNLESNLVKLHSVDITESNLEGRFETSPITIEPTQTSGRNEESRFDIEPTQTSGRNDVSNVVIPEIDPDGRHTVSDIDPIMSTLRGRFETSDIEPVESILNGRHAKTDGAGIEIEPGNSDTIIVPTTFQVYDDADVEVKALFNYGQAVNFDGSLVNINTADTSQQERAIKAPSALPFTTTLGQPFSMIGTNVFAPGYSNIENRINFTDEQNVNTFGSNGTGFAIQFSNIVADAHINPGNTTDPNYHGAQDLPIPQQPLTILPATSLDKNLNIFVTESNLYTVVDPQTFEISTFANQLGTKGSFASDGSYEQGDLPQTYIEQLEPLDLDYTIPFNAGDPNSVMAAYGYDIIDTIPNFVVPNGQMYLIQPTANSPFGSVMVTGMHTGLMEQENPSFFDQTVTGLGMLQTYTVPASPSDAIVQFPEVTITGGKENYDLAAVETNTITTSLFGGRTLRQQGIVDTINNTTFELEEQIDSGRLFGSGTSRTGRFFPRQLTNFAPTADEGSKYSGIDGLTYTHPGTDAQYAHRTIFESAFGDDQTLGSSFTGVSTPIAYDESNHLTPGTFRVFNVNQTQTAPINYVQVNDNEELEFRDSEFAITRTAGGRYIHRLGEYGLDTTVQKVSVPGELQSQLPKLYNSSVGEPQYATPLGKKQSAVDLNFNNNIADEGVGYEEYITNLIRQGEADGMIGLAFPALSGRNISDATAGLKSLKDMMLRKKTYRIWEQHNSYTTQGADGIHKGLTHYQVLTGASNVLSGWFPEFTQPAVEGNPNAQRYYSVLGYPGLMVANALSQTGEVMDFRGLINDPGAMFYGEATISNYSSNSLHARGGSYQQGRVGYARRDYRQPTTKNAPYGGDAITQQGISGASIEDMEKEYGDLIKFYIYDPIGGKRLRFRSYITAINDAFGASWDSVKYIGRPNNMFIYNGAADRKFSFNLKVASLSRTDVIPMWQKINYLASLVYPHQSETKQMLGPIVGLTLGDWFNEEPGFFDSINITVDQTTPWDINMEDGRYNKGKVGEKLLAAAKTGGLRGAFNSGLNQLKDSVKSKVLNQPVDEKGQQVAQLPMVVDITLGFTSMATANRRVGGDMFGCWVADANGGEPKWVTDPGGQFKFPKKSALDHLFGTKAGGVMGSTAGKILGKTLGGL